jgi:hypothetical protein
MKSVKFLKKGIKVDGKYFPVRYDMGQLLNYPAGTITIYVRNYASLPDFGAKIDNGTDIQMDYFEKDKVRISPSDPFYAEARRMVAA